MLKLKRLKVLHYRNVAPGSELRFDDGINLILGQNASGKTTLLALISAVCRSSFEGIKDEEFELEYEIASEPFSLEVSVAHRRIHISKESALPGAEPMWDDHFHLTITDSDTEQSRRFTSDPPAEGQKVVNLTRGGGRFFATLFIPILTWTKQFLVDLNDATNAFRFDESLDSFIAITGRNNPLPSPATPTVVRAKWSGKPGHPPFQETSLERSAFTPDIVDFPDHPVLVTQPLGPADRARAVERTMARHLGADAVTITPNVRQKSVSASERTYEIEGFTFEVTRTDGTTIHHDRLSSGQKRLLAFLYYLECNPAVVIADELVNGLHHRWIDACMNELGERQAFLTSQNPLLFDYATFDAVERVQSAFVICSLEVRDGREEMIWRNMSREDAQIFFDAYQAGVEHVGDILITRGLW